jgi:hypothetical protein
MEVIGVDVVQMLCPGGHIYCLECLINYYKTKERSARISCFLCKNGTCFILNRLLGNIGASCSTTDQTKKTKILNTFIQKMDIIKNEYPSLFRHELETVYTPDHVQIYLMNELNVTDTISYPRIVMPSDLTGPSLGYMFVSILDESTIVMDYIRDVNSIEDVIRTHNYENDVSFICWLRNDTFLDSHVIRQVSPVDIIFISSIRDYIESTFSRNDMFELLLNKFEEFITLRNNGNMALSQMETN